MPSEKYERVLIVREGDVHELSVQILQFLQEIRLPRKAYSNIEWQLSSRNIRTTDGLIKKVNEMLRPWRFAFYASRGYNRPGILVYDFVSV